MESHRFSRRSVLAGLAGLSGLAPVGRADAADRIGDVETLQGSVFARLGETRRQLRTRAEIMLGDLVSTERQSRTTLALGRTRVSLGEATQLTIDKFIADKGGDLVLGNGALVFDRADSLPKVDIEVRSAFGLIGVRGTRFFMGPASGRFGVFVARGTVSVRAAGASRTLNAGDGVDFERPGGPPSEVRRWAQPRIDAAFARVFG